MEKREAKMGGREGRETLPFLFHHPHPHRRLENLHSSNIQGRPDTQDIVTLSSGLGVKTGLTSGYGFLMFKVRKRLEKSSSFEFQS